MTDEEKKKKIIELLKKEGEMPLGEISFRIKTNYYKTKYLLNELKNEKKVLNGTRGRGSYWKLMEKKK